MILGSTGLDRFIAGQHAVEVQHPVAGGPRDPQPDRRTVCIPLLPTLIFHAPSHGHTHTHTHLHAQHSHRHNMDSAGFRLSTVYSAEQLCP